MKKIITLALVLVLVLSLVGCAAPKTTTGLGIEVKQTATGVDATIATVTLDAKGKIIAVSIDAVQNKYKLENGAITFNADKATKTKKDLGDAYAMKGVSVIKKEWFEQIASLEAWMIGKTPAEVAAMKTFKRDDSHVAVPDEADLKTTVTITVEGYLNAVAEAAKNAK